MAQEVQVSEGKLKVKFESMDKRFTNLELGLGEISERLSKIPSVDHDTFTGMQKRIEDLETLMSVEQAGVIELQKVMSSIDQKFSDSKSFLSEEAQNLLQRMNSAEQKIGLLSSEKVASDLMNMELKLEKTSTDIDKMVESTKNEVEKLAERTKLIDPEVITKIVKEVTELRSDLGKEIREIKEKIDSEDSTRAEVEMKFLVSRVNSIKENLDFLLNRKVEIEQKVDNVEKKLAKISNTKFETLSTVNSLKDNLDSLMKNRAEFEQKVENMDQKIEEVEKNLLNIANSKFESLGEEFFKKSDLDKQGLMRLSSRIDRLEKDFRREVEKMSSIKQLETSPSDVYSTLEIDKRIGILEGKLNDIGNRVYASKSSSLDMQIEQLLEKIVTLESRLAALERTYFEPKRVQPIVLE